MNETASRSRIRLGLRSVSLLAVSLTAASLLACIAAIPVAVHYFQTPDGYVAEAETNKSADEVWTAIVRIAERRQAEGRGEILEKDDEDRQIEVTDGVQTATAKVIPLEKGRARLTIIADIPEGEEGEDVERQKEQELAARIMKNLCKEAKARCKVVEK